MRDNCANATAAMRVPDMARPCLFRHAPGLAVGEPDDRLLRGIQYAAASRFIAAAVEYRIPRFGGA